MLDVRGYSGWGCQFICTLSNCDWTLGVGSDCQAGNIQEGRFFLQPPGIGDDKPCFFNEPDRVQVIHRIGDDQSWQVFRFLPNSKGGHLFPGPGVDGENDIDPAGQTIQRLHN